MPGAGVCTDGVEGAGGYMLAVTAVLDPAAGGGIIVCVGASSRVAPASGGPDNAVLAACAW